MIKEEEIEFFGAPACRRVVSLRHKLLRSRELTFDLIKGLLDEVSRLDVEVVVARVAHGQHYEIVKQLLCA